MSVRVNLLPRQARKRAQAQRANLLVVLVVAVVAGLLALLYLNKSGAVDDALAERDAAQAQVNQLQAQVASLQAFQSLADEVAAGDSLVTNAFGQEIGIARILNDVALSLPSTSSLTTLTLSRLAQEPAAGEIELADTIANLLLTGYSIERYAPGVEGVLLQFDEVQGLVITYLNNAAAAEIGTVGVTTFDANGLLDSEVLTGRYAEGLPEEGP